MSSKATPSMQDDAQLSPDPKVKSKSMLKKFKSLFGSRKSKRVRSRSFEPEGSNTLAPDVNAGLKEPGSELKDPSNENAPMSMSVDCLYSSKQDTESTADAAPKLTSTNSRSAEGLSNKNIFYGELNRKLLNRRSLEDDGLPGSPVGTLPTTADLLAQPNFLYQGSSRTDSDGSLMSIGSSENEEEAFFKLSWKSLTSSGRYSASSDSESSDVDLDAVSNTAQLNNTAAMHKRNIRPKNKHTSRRVTNASSIMPRLEEKKTLEIAHTFLDEVATNSTKPSWRLNDQPLLQSSQLRPQANLKRSESDRVQASPEEQSPKVDASVPSAIPGVITRNSSTPSRPSSDNVLTSSSPAYRKSAEYPEREASRSSTKSTDSAEAESKRSSLTESPVDIRLNIVGESDPKNKPPAIQPRPKSMYHPPSTGSDAIVDTKHPNSRQQFSSQMLSSEMLAQEKSNSLPDWSKGVSRSTKISSKPPEHDVKSFSPELHEAPQPANRANVPIPALRKVPVPASRSTEKPSEASPTSQTSQQPKKGVDDEALKQSQPASNQMLLNKIKKESDAGSESKKLEQTATLRPRSLSSETSRTVGGADSINKPFQTEVSKNQSDSADNLTDFSDIHYPELSRLNQPELKKTLPIDASKTQRPDSGKVLRPPENSKGTLSEPPKTQRPDSFKTVQEPFKSSPPDSSKSTPADSSKSTPAGSIKSSPPDSSKPITPESRKTPVPETHKSPLPESRRITENAKSLHPEPIKTHEFSKTHDVSSRQPIESNKAEPVKANPPESRPELPAPGSKAPLKPSVQKPVRTTPPEGKLAANAAAMFASSEDLEGAIQAARTKTTTVEISAKKPQSTPPESLTPDQQISTLREEEPKSFKDRLKMFQQK